MKKLLISTLLFTSISCMRDQLKEYNNKLKKELAKAQNQFSSLVKEFRKLKDQSLEIISSLKQSKIEDEDIRNLEVCINELNNNLRATRKDLLTSYKRKRGLKLAGSVAILANNQRKSLEVQEILNEIVKNCNRILDKNLNLADKLKSDLINLKREAQHLLYIIASYEPSTKEDNEKKAKKAKFYKKQVSLKELLGSLERYIEEEGTLKNSKEFDKLIILTEEMKKSFDESKKYVNDSQIELDDKGIKELAEIDKKIQKDLNELYGLFIKLPSPKKFNENTYNSMVINLGSSLKIKEAIVIKRVSSFSDALENKKKLKALSEISKENYNKFYNIFFGYIGPLGMLEYVKGQKNITEYKSKIIELFKDKNFKESLRILEKDILGIDNIEKRLKAKELLDDLKLQLKRIKKEAQN